MSEFLSFHPYADLFPLLEGDDFDRLITDIEQNGLLHPIVVLDSAILDGRNRYRACLEAQVPIRTERFTGRDPLAFVVSSNLYRRHLSESQRAMVASKIANLPKGSNQHAQICAPSQKQAADLLNVSRRTVQTAKTVMDHGAPELVKLVEADKISVSAAADVSTLPMSEQQELVARGEREILEAAKRLRAHHKTTGTGENEWYTPAKYIDAARVVIGDIDLDPASCEAANKVVGAKHFFSVADDGLSQAWYGRVWMNPPYSQPEIKQFIEKLVDEVEAGHVSEAIALTHNNSDTTWFHCAANSAKAFCLTKGRIAFESPHGEKAAPAQGQTFFYFGDNVTKFREVFEPFGLVREY